MNHKEDYTNRELDAKFESIHEKLDLILTQTTKTNGSVINLKLWRSYLTGALAILTLVVLPALGYLALTLLNVDKEISSHISATK